ncbi:MAG: hypothetical protein AAB690_00935 [Patescibacteria group bacterium]
MEQNRFEGGIGRIPSGEYLAQVEAAQKGRPEAKDLGARVDDAIDGSEKLSVLEESPARETGPQKLSEIGSSYRKDTHRWEKGVKRNESSAEKAKQRMLRQARKERRSIMN